MILLLTDPGVDAARRAAHQILTRPEFHPAPQPLADRARQWVIREVLSFLDRAVSGFAPGPLGAVLAVAVATALLVLAVRAIRGSTRNPVRRPVELVGPRRPSSDWLAEARRCEAERDWRGALRCRYRALVADLAGRGLVDEIPGRTTGEYRREVESSVPESAAPFATATELFEAAWYGDQPVTDTEASRFRSLAAAVLAGAR